jgi:RNA polymerase sigma-70 factor (ECF subfamily)
MDEAPAPPAAALARLYDRYGAFVFRRARRMLNDDQAAQDACQEVFLRLWRAQPRFDTTSPVTWLFQVTTNYCLNQLRDRQRRERLDPGQAPTSATPGLPLQLLLRGIPEELHALAVHYYLDQMSQDEIAVALGLSQRTVSNRLKEFRAVIERAWGLSAKEAT